MIYKNISELIGNTPILELPNIKKARNLNCNIFAKLEYFNPAGSVKDRVALNMIIDAEEKGILKKNSVIIEPTSGNTGIGLSMVALSKGYRAVIVMPDTMSVERRKLISAYGAEVLLTDGKLGMQGAIDKAEEIAKNTENSFIAGQFTNPANSDAHYKTTAPEIYKDMDGKIDYFVAGVGTGGTITGVAKYLKEKNPDIKIIGVEPLSSPVLSGGEKGPHAIQGIGAGFVPDVLDISLIDEIIKVSDKDAYSVTNELVKKEGILVGISSGAAMCGAIEIAKNNKDKNIVVLLPDTGTRYLSEELF